MNAAPHPKWPELLRDYEAAITAFESVSRGLTAVLAEGSSGEDDFRALVAAEERARETVILARMRIINLWRESEAEPFGSNAPTPAGTQTR